MKKLLLKINPRFGIRGLLNDKYAKGGLGLEMLRDAQNIMQKILVEIIWSEKPEKDGTIKATGKEDAKKVNLRRTLVIQDGKQTQQIVWDIDKDKGKEIELNDDEAKLLVELIKDKNTKKEFKIDDAWVQGVAEQLEIK